MFSFGHCPNEGGGRALPELKNTLYKLYIPLWRPKKMYKLPERRGKHLFLYEVFPKCITSLIMSIILSKYCFSLNGCSKFNSCQWGHFLCSYPVRASPPFNANSIAILLRFSFFWPHFWHTLYIVIMMAWVTRPERPKSAMDDVKQGHKLLVYYISLYLVCEI